MAKVVTLGEIMLRLSPNGQDRFVQTDIFRIIPGGGEANVAISVPIMVMMLISYQSFQHTKLVR